MKLYTYIAMFRWRFASQKKKEKKRVLHRRCDRISFFFKINVGRRECIETGSRFLSCSSNFFLHSAYYICRKYFSLDKIYHLTE